MLPTDEELVEEGKLDEEINSEYENNENREEGD